MPFISRSPAGSVPLYQGSDQYNWLTNDLASTTSRGNSYCSSSTCSQAATATTTTALIAYGCSSSARFLLPVATRYGVEMIFNGHDHDSSASIQFRVCSSLPTAQVEVKSTGFRTSVMPQFSVLRNSRISQSDHQGTRCSFRPLPQMAMCRLHESAANSAFSATL